MHRILPIFISTVCGLSFAPMIIALPLIAHQNQMVSADSIGATIHVDPNDIPLAGEASQTWFMLAQKDGSMIALENCDCQVMAYDSNNEPLAHHLPLSTISVQGHEAIGTTITFPTPGSYTVVLSGESKDGSFSPFRIEFPIMAVNP
ncbi:hypothetical protein IQ268_15975 [Oculatella sp. LEGE 06141]|uniref:hypothetical protein n=1 Tax=Oculatella sp. LEGE 06141 TaxID=1828648 RepID=UPI001882EC0D|nr:hypothetical protein [Oculatella sp. LEGE 06141]MBE9180069.1 hypothetical protein [Oculatella sp. LEGE 06141]